METTTGTFGPPMTWDEAQRETQRAHAQRMADLHAVALAEQARQALGYRQQSQQAYDGAPVYLSWARIADEQVRGLPAKLVEDARRAASAEQEAARAVASATAAVQAYGQKHGLSREALNTKWELDTAELRTAATEAQRAAMRALAALGRAAADLAQIRADLKAIPERIRQRRQECSAAEQADIATQKELAARLAAYGLLT